MRLSALDSLRGVAAATVVFHHALLIFPRIDEDRQISFADGVTLSQHWVSSTPLRLLVSGPAAVMVFFVLSGLVLTLSVNGRKYPGYPGFALARFLRIWVPFAVAIMCSAGLYLLLYEGPVAIASPWFNMTWDVGATADNLTGHFLMTGRAVDMDNPAWSLIHEMRISLIFPLLVLLVAGSRGLAIVWSAALTIAVVYLQKMSLVSPAWPHFIYTIMYVYFFVIGIEIARHLGAVKAFVNSLGRPVIVLLWLCCLTGIIMAPEDTASVNTMKDGLRLLVSGLSAGGVIILCLRDGNVARWLTAAVPSYLGRISYSLYLIHVVAFAAIVRLGTPTLPLWLSVVVAILLSVAIADVLYRLVEVGSHRLAKSVPRRLGLADPLKAAS